MDEPRQIKIKAHHIEQVERILNNIVSLLQRGFIKVGEYKACPTVESIDLRNPAVNAQPDEAELDENGQRNPLIIDCVINALEIAFLKSGRSIYGNPADKIYTYDQETSTTSATNVVRGGVSAYANPNVICISASTSLSSIIVLTLSGHEIKSAVDQLTKEGLHQATIEAITSNIENKNAFIGRVTERPVGGQVIS